MTQKAHRLALPAGTRLHWYEIHSVLGVGGFGITYLAQDTNLDRRVAIKEYLPAEFATRVGDGSVQPASVESEEIYQWGLGRFIKEAQLLSRFEHPNIVRVHTVFEENNTGYMVMAYEHGQSLKAILDEAKTLDEAALMGLLLPIMDGLEQVHTKGFIHRDIKPGNIYVREDGSPVLLDFGSARPAVGESRTMVTMVSEGYAPFEQHYPKGQEQGPWTDIYSLGATLYRAITGSVPEDAVYRSQSLMDGTRAQQASVSVLAKGRYSPMLLAAVDHAMQFKPADRPQSIAQWRAEFGGAVDTEPTRLIVRSPAGPVPAANPGLPGADSHIPRKSLLAAGGVAAALVVIVGYFLIAAAGRGSRPASSGASVVAAAAGNQTAAPLPMTNPNPDEAGPQSQANDRQSALRLAEQQAEKERQRALTAEKQLQEEKAAEVKRTAAAEQLAAQQAAAEKLAEEQKQLMAQKAAEKQRLAEEKRREEARKLAEEKRRQEQFAAQQQEAVVEKEIAQSRRLFAARMAKSEDSYPYADTPAPRTLSATDASADVQVFCKEKDWQSAGVMIKRGRTYTITAVGTWSIGPLCKATDASGQGAYTLACWNTPTQTVLGRSHAALIGKIGKGTLAFYVGPKFTFTADHDGPLYFHSNDAPAFLYDDSGSLRVTVQLVEGGGDKLEGE